MLATSLAAPHRMSYPVDVLSVAYRMHHQEEGIGKFTPCFRL
jgi:hypothetical protein